MEANLHYIMEIKISPIQIMEEYPLLLIRILIIMEIKISPIQIKEENLRLLIRILIQRIMVNRMEEDLQELMRNLNKTKKMVLNLHQLMGNRILVRRIKIMEK